MSEEEPWKIHSSWVSRLMYLTHSCSLLSSSMDGQLMMLDIEKQRKKWSAKEHQRGICAFSYGRTLNFIASCGLERHINIWNPFTARIMGTLIGHQAPVVDVVVNDKDNQVVSVASDNLIKVWDMRNNKCLQTIYERPNQKSLDPPIMCRLFYDQSKSVVVGEETDSTITIWDIETGGKIFSFSDTSKRTKMSAMSFDFSRRRLVIGGQDGRLSMWNFNNGQCLKEFKGFGQNEVSCVACLEEGKVKFVAAGGWNGKVCIWGDGTKEHELVEHSTRGHADDVICMTFFPPNCFATGGYDGKVIVWKVDGMIRCVLQTSNNESREDSCNPITSLLNLPKVLEVSLGHSAQPGPICVDSSNQALFTSDIKGYVKAWTMKDFECAKGEGDSKMLEQFCFRAHHETIVSMIFIDDKRLLLTASVFFTCRLWTDTGVRIGQFGQASAWNLQVPESWASKSPTYATSIPCVRDLESISSTRSSSRISTSAGTSGNHSNNSRQTSRGVLNTAPLDVPKKPEDLFHKQKSGSLDETTKENPLENERYPYPNIANVLDGGPPHLRLDSWFKSLQLAYNRKLPTKDLTPFGVVIPPNLSLIRKKWSRESCTPGAGCRRKKSKVQDSPPRLSLPRFRFNPAAFSFSTMKSETSSSGSSLGDNSK